MKAETKAKHTPGPWKLWDGYGPLSDGLVRVARIGADRRGVRGETGHGIVGTQEDLELIAAAPDLPHPCDDPNCLGGQRWQAHKDLLAAAKSAQKMLASRLGDFLPELDAAIAQAEGGAAEGRENEPKSD